MANLNRLTAEQKRLLNDYDPVLRELNAAGLLDAMIVSNNEIDAYKSHADLVAADPKNAVAATLATDLVGLNNDLVFTAKTKGVIGNSIKVVYVDPQANDAALAVTVSGTIITVSLQTGGAGAITSTAAQVTAAIAALPAAHALVAVTNKDGHNGTGVVTAMAETALASGVDGTVGVKGDILLTTGKIWVCTAANGTADGNWKYAALT